MNPAARPELVRSIGRWALAGLVLNGVLGSAIYGLPSSVAARLGGAAPLAWLLAAGLIGVIIACFAEVASRFRDAGGPYLYVRATFGSFLGLQTGWMAYLARLTASAAVANLFVTYLGEFWPGAAGRGAGLVVLALLLGGLALANYRGVAMGSRVSSVLAVAKVSALALFAIVGIVWVAGHGRVAGPPMEFTLKPWLAVMLPLVFAYGGFEAALLPLAEASDPERDAPIALLTALAVCTVLYTLVQAVVTWTLPEAGTAARPLADSARAMLGNPGAGFISACALLSTFGYLAGGMVNVPRLTLAMADRGDLPRIFAVVHPVFRTPWVSIACYAIAVFAMAATAKFLQNVTLSVVARLVTYGLVSAALPILRRRDGTPRGVAPAAFRLPGGALFAVLGVIGMIVVATQVSANEARILGVVIILASVHWALQAAARRT